MHCNTCGSDIPPTASFCPECGSPVGPPQPTSVPEASSLATSSQMTNAPDVKKSRSGGVTLVLSLLLIGLVLVFQIVGVAISELTGWDLDALVTVFGALGGIVSLLILGGRHLFALDAASFARAWREGWWVVAISIGLALFDVVTTLVAGESLVVEGWQLRTLGLLLLCLGIGVYEESVFRGLLLGGGLDAFGTRKAGIVVVAVVTSLLFGMAHVAWGDLDYANPLDVAQAVLKTVQTGTYGFFLASLVMRTNNIFGAVTLHAFDDFFLMLPSVGLGDLKVEAEYVSSGADALPTIILYCVIIVLYLPIVWRGVLLLNECEPPQRGAFHKESDVDAFPRSQRC